MSALQHDLPDARVVDLFAGSGALGLEALSRGARHVTFVEKAAAPLRALESNVRELGAAAESDVVKMDALRYVESLAAHAFDIALADPPYGTDAVQRLVAAFREVPFARLLCVEHASRETLDAPDVARTRRYGDTTLTFIPAPHE